MIILITVKEKNRKTGKRETLVSHGVNMDTLEICVLPNVPPSEIGYFNGRLGEWILRD